MYCNQELECVEFDELVRAQYGDEAAAVPARHRAKQSWGDRSRWTNTEYEPWYAAAKEEAAAGGWGWQVDPFRDVAGGDDAMVADTVWRQVLILTRQIEGPGREREERAAQAALVRDLFAGPAGPPAFAPAWRTPAVTELARAVYDGGAWERMPALGAALRAAGCDQPAFLRHCSKIGPHARCCWAVDAILGKG